VITSYTLGLNFYNRVILAMGPYLGGDVNPISPHIIIIGRYNRSAEECDSGSDSFTLEDVAAERPGYPR